MFPSALTQPVIEKLGYYVYLYRDPETGSIFYVGKGKGDRALVHLEDTAETEKVRKIQALKTKGREPIIEILVHGLQDEETALRIEAAVIDLLEIGKLTNQVRGYHSSIEGKASLTDLIAKYDPQHITIAEPAILIRVNQFFRYGMSEEELYEITRGVWKVGARREQAKFAFAIYGGIVRAVYQIHRWLPAGTLEYKTRTIEICDRWEFEGQFASQETWNKYFNKSVSRYFPANSQNPIMYVNC